MSKRKLTELEKEAIKKLFEVCKPIFERWTEEDCWPEELAPTDDFQDTEK